MESNSPIASVDKEPPYEATGGRTINVRGVHKRHVQLLSVLQEEMGGVGRREAIAALVEYYAGNADKVLKYSDGVEFRRR